MPSSFIHRQILILYSPLDRVSQQVDGWSEFSKILIVHTVLIMQKQEEKQ